MGVSARVPPQALEAEESVLGAMMLSPNAIGKVGEVLEPSDFYRKSHGKIYSAAFALYATGSPVDAITLADYLDEHGQLIEVGGRNRVFELASLVPTTANVGHYAKIVREMSILRSMILVGEEIASNGYERPDATTALLEQAEHNIYKIRRGLPEHRDLEKDVSDLVAAWQELAEHPRDILGIPAGFVDLDSVTHGFMPGTMNVLAARPSMGKTALALCIANHVAVEKEIPTVMFSLEMSRLELIHRLVSMEANVDNTKLRHSWRLDAAEWDRVYKAAETLGRAPLTIYDDGLIRPQGIRTKIRQLSAKQNIGLVIVDYLQLMASDKNTDSLTEDVTYISRALKVLAKEFDVPVLALSQLSRQVESRGDKRPLLSDLRQSGAIEQDADLVMMMYRDNYYNPESPAGNVVEINLAKHRNGQTGMVELAWEPEQVKFSSLYRPPDMSGV